MSNVEKTGIDIKIAPSVTAKCGVQHLSDAPSVQKPETMYSVDQLIQCRVLYVDEEETVFNSFLNFVCLFSYFVDRSMSQTNPHWSTVHFESFQVTIMLFQELLHTAGLVK